MEKKLLARRRYRNGQNWIIGVRNAKGRVKNVEAGVSHFLKDAQEFAWCSQKGRSFRHGSQKQRLEREPEAGSKSLSRATAWRVGGALGRMADELEGPWTQQQGGLWVWTLVGRRNPLEVVMLICCRNAAFLTTHLSLISCTINWMLVFLFINPYFSAFMADLVGQYSQEAPLLRFYTITKTQNFMMR